MADEEQQTPEPNADTPPPGSSESFNEFKDRILSTLGGYAAANEGHNTVFVTHSKAIGTWNGWEHAGYPEDQSIHMPTYEEAKEKAPGGHEEVELPEHIQAELARNAAAQRTRQSVIPEGGRQELSREQWEPVDLTPVHEPGTEPKDYLRELSNNPDILDATIAQASNFNFGGIVSKMPSKEIMLDMVNRNLRPKEMAKELGVDRNAVYRYLDKYGLDKAGAKGPKPLEVDWDLYDRLKSKGITERDIAAAFGVEQRTLYDARVKSGRAGSQEVPPAETAAAKLNTGNVRNDVILNSVINEGKTFTQTAEEVGGNVTRNTVAGLIQRYKRDPENFSSNLKFARKYPEGYWDKGGEGDRRLLEMHQERRMTSKEIASELNLDVQTVRRLLNARDLSPNQTYLSKLDYKAIKGRLENGESIKAIAKDLEVHPSTIYSGLNARNIKYGQYTKRSKEPEPVYVDKEKLPSMVDPDKITEMRSQGSSWRSIAKSFGDNVTGSEIYRIAKNKGYIGGYGIPDLK